jgi:diguanylate cyclase (GGDEF)-like protein
MLEASQLVFAAEEAVSRRLDTPLGNPVHAESLLARIGNLEREKRELEMLTAHLELNVKQLVRLVYVDALTGLSNRRHFDSELRVAVDRAALSSQPLALLMCDIDRFKHYNDTYGHGHGDAVLTEIAGLLKTSRRSEQDCAARYGGEEFALLLHGCDGENALKFFERLQGATLQGQTFSAGVAETDGKEEGSVALQRADEALYRAKAGGRNRTVLAERTRAAA